MIGRTSELRLGIDRLRCDPRTFEADDGVRSGQRRGRRKRGEDASEFLAEALTPLPQIRCNSVTGPTPVFGRAQPAAASTAPSEFRLHPRARG